MNTKLSLIFDFFEDKEFSFEFDGILYKLDCFKHPWGKNRNFVKICSSDTYPMFIDLKDEKIIDYLLALILNFHVRNL